MRRCRKCNRDWPDTMTACPNDGWSLTASTDPTVAAPNVPVAPPGASTAIAAAPPPPAADPAMMLDLAPGFVVGEYRVERKIGEGGMGAVYAATHPMIGKRAAIKVISAALGTNAEAVGRFVQEARSVNQIGHPNIVDVFAFGQLPDGRNYFVMDYLQGESLADRLQRAAMPLGEAIEILDQVADALDAAHEKQIIHRDLKPDNVYLAAVRGRRTMVKLLDFGIAKLSVPDGLGSGGGIAKTRTGMMMGTPGYLSPEQARGKNVDHRTDIYALGCMTFEIVCGRLPFLADNAMDIVMMHMSAPAPRASSVWPDIPKPLDDLIARMLEKDPAARPTLAEVRAVFSELVTSGLVTLGSGHGIAFGSDIGRVKTPGGSMPGPATQYLAVGTTPQGSGPSTQPPVAVRKKTGLVAALVGLVLVGGGAAAVFALRAEDARPAAVPPAQHVPPAAAPTPPPPPPQAAAAPTLPAPPTPVPEPVKPATIDIAINVDKAEVTVDGKHVDVAAKTARVTVEQAGAHIVAVTAHGRVPFEQTVETKPGEVAQVVATLERVPQKSVATATKPTKKPPSLPEGAGSGSATKPKPTFVDKNATINPF